MSKPTAESFKRDSRRLPKNRGSQLLVIVAILVIVVGAGLSIGGSWIGFVVLAGGFAALIALTVWAVRTWDW